MVVVSCGRNVSGGIGRRTCGAIVVLGLAPGLLWAAGAHTTQFERTTYLDHIRYLASDDLRGRGMGEPGLDQAADYIAEGFAAFGVKPGARDGTYFQPFEAPRLRGAGLLNLLFGSKRIRTRNVIGAIPGEGPLARQYVVVGAHYDHLGVKAAGGDGAVRPPPPGTVFHGADDNASGTAGLLELARHFGLRQGGDGSRRGLLLIAFSAEEHGMLGSWQFVKDPAIPLEDIVAMINLDMIGRMYGKPLMVFGSNTAVEFGALLRKASRQFGMPLEMPAGEAGLSDHSPFHVRRIPVLHFFSGIHPDLHRPTDETERIDAPGAERVLDVVYCVTDDLLTCEAAPTFQASGVARPTGGEDTAAERGTASGE